MIRNVLLIAFLMISSFVIGQKTQRIGYIDMEYILQNLPEYNEAQAKINEKSNSWLSNIDKQQKEIDALKAELNNEKALLTKELISEKEEDILIKELDLKKLQNAYYGTNGDLFFLRKQLVQPIQDLVYNAIQDIAKNRKYDFVLDNSSSLVMLYSNDAYNISDLVITSINRIKKIEEVKDKQQAKNNPTTDATATVVNEEVEKRATEREDKRAELQKRLDDKKAEQLKKREELKQAIEEKRLERLKEIEEAKQAKEEKAEEQEQENSQKQEATNKTESKTDSTTVADKTVDKRAELQKKLDEKKAEQLKKREELKKAIEEKRLQRLKEIEEAKQAKEEKVQEQQDENAQEQEEQKEQEENN